MTENGSTRTHQAVVIGGGPAGLMAAEVLAQQGIEVALYDAMASVGRKFLLAGKGGMNITHSEPEAAFLARYREGSPHLAPALQEFGAHALREWVRTLGLDTFVGSSGRVFPTDMKAAPLLRAWLQRLRQQGVRIYTRHRWQGWGENRELVFRAPSGDVSVTGEVVVLALGGGSWQRLGSDGAWVPWLQAKDVSVRALQPSNCGFEVNWSEHLRTRFAGTPLKSVLIRFTDANGQEHAQKGECVISANGIEGGLIYALSAPLRETLQQQGSVTLAVDLAPDRSASQLLAALQHPRGKDSVSNHLRKRAGVEGVRAALLREVLDTAAMQDMERVARTLKALPLRLQATRPLDEAISSAGGVMFEALDAYYMLRSLPGVFCAGEMLDWEAPTGGYLLTACFASGRRAGLGAAQWLAGSASTPG